jgi:hypothetical protein
MSNKKRPLVQIPEFRGVVSVLGGVNPDTIWEDVFETKLETHEENGKKTHLVVKQSEPVSPAFLIVNPKKKN